MATFHPQIFGRYLLVDRLGAGGMAEVYRAKIFGIDGFEKQLAVKRILSNFSEDRQFIEMLTNEAKLSVQLNHTNIVQVYDFGKVGADYFMAMEFVFGVNLHDILHQLHQSDRKLPEDISIYMICEVCRGLDYAHFKKGADHRPLGVIHRDISPPNILVSYEGEVKVADFGIAKAAMNISHTMTGVIKGKISYMSPEQAKGENLDHRSDVFSVGMVLYEMLTGEKLFTGNTQFEVLRKIQQTHIQEKDLSEAIPAELRKILAKTLTYDREERYASASHLQADLSHYLNTVYPAFTSRTLRDLMQQLFSEEIEQDKERLEAQEQAEDQLTVVKKFREDQKQAPIPRPLAAKNKTPRPPKPPKDEIFPTSVGYFSVPTKQKMTPILFAGAGILATLLALWLWLRPSSETSGNRSGDMVLLNEPAVFGKLLIQSIPEGAAIFIDGKSIEQKTPELVDTLEVGKPFQLNLKLPGYEEWSQSVTLSNTDPLNLNPKLIALPKGMVIINSDPPGAKIFLNNENTGHATPAILEGIDIGKPYRLRLELDRYIPLDESFSLATDGRLKIDRKLTMIPVKKTTPVVQTKKPSAREPIRNREAPPPPPPVTVSVEGKKESNGGALNTMEKGFKKAGSGIKGFFTGKKSEKEAPPPPPENP